VIYIKLKIALLESGMTSQELAARLGRHETQLSRQVNGSRPWRPGDYEKVGKILRRPARDLFPEDEQAP
jgi:transcriptional regulator with XRE-family HTH domain